MNDGRRIRYVLDTDTTSAIQRRQPEATRRFAGLDPTTVPSTVVSLYAQLRGRLAVVNRARDAAALQVAFALLMETHDYFREREVLPFDSVAADIVRSLSAQRLRIGTQDLWIAAITLANDAVLV